MATHTDSTTTTTTPDPHIFPEMAPAVAGQIAAPILYLPPLLSSLPSCHHNAAEPCHGGHFPMKPLHTEVRLPEIDAASLSLHHALHHFRPLDRQYSSKEYAEAFNWDEIMLPEDEEREWYCVAFRSKRKRGSNSEALYVADAKAHDEAIRNGGLIMYRYGVPDERTGMNLATCIWQSRKHAVTGASKPSHVHAMRLTAESYDVYRLERYVLRKAAGERAVTVEEYRGGEVGW
ncbi:hypothetical protein DACRYDRAFT_20965 [Dacryopinax primogenitus]|uniref:Uncharacterized protein n=1 Tax=Dacryopinax primogenitus (strain DJM 731) TaxID=1858805 RepID=M5GFU2_DACPD|nr:uncharacterized protein DACRYDRAFT_20965 [Dacryopinax primogenitus]EJU04433.1 hypothetical protein DACRYDRAFT_20965 [Dacryopinax primogenitus]